MFPVTLRQANANSEAGRRWCCFLSVSPRVIDACGVQLEIMSFSHKCLNNQTLISQLKTRKESNPCLQECFAFSFSSCIASHPEVWMAQRVPGSVSQLLMPPAGVSSAAGRDQKKSSCHQSVARSHSKERLWDLMGKETFATFSPAGQILRIYAARLMVLAISCG